MEQSYEGLYEFMIKEIRRVKKHYLNEDPFILEDGHLQISDQGLNKPEFIYMRTAVYFLQKGIEAHYKERKIQKEGMKAHAEETPITDTKPTT